MNELRFHGRGGQEAVIAAEWLARDAINEYRFTQAYPSFGPERRGAPVQAFARVSDQVIHNRTAIFFPTGAVELEHRDERRSLSSRHRDVRIQFCTICGRDIAPVEQLDAFAASTGIPRDRLNICTDCRSTTMHDPAWHAAADSGTSSADVKINRTSQVQRRFI